MNEHPSSAVPVVRQRIEALLQSHDIDYTLIHHRAVKTSQEAAEVRGTPLEMAAKALVMKIGTGGFGIFAFRADMRSHGRTIRKHLRVSRLRFATQEELLEFTGLRPGCVPPIGRPIFDLPLYLDTSLSQQETLVFTAGDHTCSLKLKAADWFRLCSPDSIFSFC
ncbi:MAG: YbaK/EbsC family protein [Bradymonadia bacterium]